MPDYLEMSRRLGAHVTLAKPFTSQQLVAAVETLLRMPARPAPPLPPSVPDRIETRPPRWTTPRPDHSGAFLRAVLDHTGEAVIAINQDHRITEFNRTAETMFGYLAAEVLGENVNLLMPEPDRSAHDGYINPMSGPVPPRSSASAAKSAPAARTARSFPPT